MATPAPPVPQAGVPAPGPDAPTGETLGRTTRPKIYRKAATSQDRGHKDPLDYTFKEMSSLQELKEEEPNGGKKIEPKDKNCSILLGNNRLESISDLMDIHTHIMESPEQLQWLDVAHNELTTVDPILLKFPNITVLYLHGNKIASLKEVDKLAKLPNLKKLSLHGNPVEELPNYRLHVSTSIPHLQMLDFINITKVDRDKAGTWKQLAQQKAAQLANGGKAPGQKKAAY
mmetsp:Transcript_38452/g.46391  ORF Transcript_38452/g.46391 Transcript_38452/m.46391 type:complete len:230 (-) Transcript_38452:431-1120(-)|eukprot:CAMPEP_0197853606 /NCGR_PEP_ID=MMETSP1438-20131217/23042_1 /TAXON_ID=1461541 /ORGANISM="Pterosperma sp., Strain CCMP1384" /LENGTH=229 /DNA_ID=CAMNT_0043468083 /DNA_START=312 /DNA_END=1001 /DNA_ORIENTATION=-